MRGPFPQSGNPHGLYRLVYAFTNESERHATHSQRPGYIILYHSSNYLTIWILKDHADAITNNLLFFCILCINASYQHLTMLWQQQGIAMTRQRRFPAPVMSQHND